MSVREKLDLQIKRLIAIEAAHRHILRKAEGDLQRDAAHRPRYLRRIKKAKRKIEKLLPRIRRLRERRAAAR